MSRALRTNRSLKSRTAATIAYGAAVGLVMATVYLMGHHWVGPVLWLWATAVLFLASRVAGHAHKDWFNPLTVLITSAAVRVGLPYVLYLLGDRPPHGFLWSPQLFELAGRGLVLATFGILAVTLGWFMASERACSRAASRLQRLDGSLALDKKTVWIASLFAVFGFTMILVFLNLNYDNSIDALVSGVIRNASLRRDATSRYSFLGFGFLTYGVLPAVYYLLFVRRAPAWLAMLPAVLVSAILSGFGQRVGALTPLVYALLGAHYRRNELRYRVRTALPLLILPVAGVLYASFMLVFRSGVGIAGGLRALSWPSLVDYLRFAAWYEIGFLHPYTFAAYFGAGVLDGASYASVGGFVTSIFLSVDSVAPGNFIVQRWLNVPVDWGIHTGLVVDLYMNTGLAAVFIGGAVTGLILRVLYDGFQRAGRGPVATLVYVVIMWQLLWTFYESMSNVFNLTMSLAFVGGVLVVSRALRDSARQAGPVTERDYAGHR